MKNLKSHPSQKGFTIIELTLAMTFLAILLITIAFIIIHITTIYQKGLAIKSINSAGRSLIDEFANAVSSAPAKSTTVLCSKFTDISERTKCESDNAHKFVYFQEYATDVELGGKQLPRVPIYGAFCTGRYSYIWNSGYALGPRYSNSPKYLKKFSYEKSGTKQSIERFHLLKFPDSNRLACASRIGNKYNDVVAGTDKVFDFSNDPNKLVLSSDPVELLSSSEEALAIYDLGIFPPAQHKLTLQSFYSGTFILATIHGGVDITSTGDYCTDTPDGLSTDFNYCAINKFNFAARAIGELNAQEKQEQQQQKKP